MGNNNSSSLPKIGLSSSYRQRKTAPYIADDDVTDQESLCHHCRQVDWGSLSIFAETLFWKLSLETITLRTAKADHDQRAPGAASCKICRIISPLNPRFGSKTPWVVKAQPFLDTGSNCERGLKGEYVGIVTELRGHPLDKEIEYEPNSFWPIIRDISGSKSSSRSSSKMISPKSIDYGRLRVLTQQCEKRHGPECNRGGASRLNGLRLIDISSRTVVEAPTGSRYIALSYVWGKQQGEGLEMDLQRPPPLIEDAISVTSSMGYHYLWIDRYCISQNNDQERHRMISQMDQVYSYASITIIDASGKDAQGGLPGVSNLARRSQKCVHIGNTTLLELSRGNFEVENSKWATRGWTYQEGYFSPRRLIFTPSQVLYICASTYGEESAYCVLGRDSPDLHAEFEHLFPIRLHSKIKATPLTPAHDLLIPLMEYSKRDLTYQHDSLDGFLGILNFCIEKLNSLSAPKILHVAWGVFAEYRGKDELGIRMDWSHKSPAQRRPHFPSWTWAGWGGPLQFTGTEITLQRPGEESSPLPHLKWQLFLTSKDDRSEDIWDLADHVWRYWSAERGRLPQEPSYATQLQITCLVVPACFQKVSLTKGQENSETQLQFGNDIRADCLNREGVSGGITAVLQIWDGIYVAAKTFLDQEPAVEDCILSLLFTSRSREKGTLSSNGSVLTFGCLLARQLDEGLYERVGVVPDILQYSSPGMHYSNSWQSEVIFLDEKGSILHDVRAQEGERESPFMAVGQRQTIVLVWVDGS